MLNFWTIIFCPWKFLFLLKPEDDFEETHDLDVRAGPSKRSPGSDLNVLPFSLEAWAVQIGPGPNRSQSVAQQCNVRFERSSFQHWELTRSCPTLPMDLLRKGETWQGIARPYRSRANLCESRESVWFCTASMGSFWGRGHLWSLLVSSLRSIGNLRIWVVEYTACKSFIFCGLHASSSKNQAYAKDIGNILKRMWITVLIIRYADLPFWIFILAASPDQILKSPAK
jgi:hypothetical protein